MAFPFDEAPLPATPFRPRRHPEWAFPEGAIVLGVTSRDKAIWVPFELRFMHILVMGSTGSGKSKLAESMLRQDFACFDGVPRGVIVIDPHGTLIKNFLDWYVAHGLEKYRPVVLIRPGDPDFTLGWNILRPRPGVDDAVIANAATDALCGARGEEASAKPQTQETLNMTFRACVAHGLTMRDAANLLSTEDSEGLRAWVISVTPSDEVRNFWTMVESLRPGEREMVLGAARRRVTDLLSTKAMQRIFGHHEASLDIRALMDQGAFVLVDVSHDAGRVSASAATTFGRLFLADIYLSCLGRPEDACPCFVYVDEVARFVIEDTARMTAEARKFRVGTVLIGQTLGQLEEVDKKIARVIKSDTRTKISFGGLEHEDCLTFAENFFRGWIDLEEPMLRFSRHEVVGYELEWLLAESETRGASDTVGSNWSRGESVEENESTTRSSSTTETTGIARGTGVTRSESETESESSTYSRSSTRSESTTETESLTETRGASDSSIQGEFSGAGQAFDYDFEMLPIGQLPNTWHASETSGRSTAEGHVDSQSVSRGLARGRTSGMAETEGLAETTGRARTRGIAVSEHETHSTSTARSTGEAETTGTSRGRNWSRGGSVAHSVNHAATAGRSQSYRPVLSVVPGAAFPLDKLIARAAWQIGNLPDGVCFVKIGRRPPSKIRTLYLPRVRVRPEHVTRVVARLATLIPFLTPTTEVDLAHREYRARLRERIALQRPKRRDPGDSGEDEWS